ncbi:MAG: radical SAM protein [Muribaculaceae bacterium]|nr:radical SAM protein [Muribaculaceae bacterium]MDE5858640.1 radical SAM protein [Muribaculaceae bacterium]
MQTVLFTSTIFGPIHSRRLGVSLGVNLMPRDGKVCTFDCLYCEAGFNAQGPGKAGIPSREEVRRLLEEKLIDMKQKGETLDVITFSGNGEPTLHPDFKGVIDDTIELRDRYFPNVKISVLSNSTRIDNQSVVEALKRVDNNILKLDSAIDSTVRLIDRPTYPAYRVDSIVNSMKQFGNDLIIQTMFLRGSHDGVEIDNTTDAEVDALIEVYKKLKPREVMIYSIDRKTPEEHLVKVEKDELQEIANKISDRAGVKVQVA